MKDQWMPLLEQTVIALMNGVLQGFLLTVFVWLLLRVFRRINASTRYLIWMGTLGCLAAFPVIHFLLAKVGTGQNVQSAKNERSVSAQSMSEVETHVIHEEIPLTDVEVAQIESSIHGDLNLDSNLGSEYPFFAEETVHSWNKPEFHFENFFEAIAPFEDEPPNLADSIVHADVTDEAVLQKAESITDQSDEVETPHALALPLGRLLQSVKNVTIPTRLPQWPVLVVLGIFAVGVVWNILKLAYDLWLLRRLKKQAFSPSHELIEMFESVTSAKGMRPGIALKVHSKLKTPLALGFFRPLILMPETLSDALNSSAKEQILKHELAHLLRYDDWTNLYQRLIQACYFFHPAVWLVSLRADVEREIACDDHVLDRAGQAKSYALMLTQFANRERDRHLASASAVWNKQSQIKERIEMLLDHHRNTAPRPARLSTGLLTTAALFVAALTLQYGPRVALADDPVASSSDTPAASGNSNFIFDDEVEEPRSKNKSNPLNSLPGILGGTQEISASSLTSPEDFASTASDSNSAQNNGTHGNPNRRSRAFNHKPVLAPESPVNPIATDAMPSQYNPSNRSNRTSGRAVRSTRLRPVPGTARVEIIDQGHSHPVEVEIINEHESGFPEANPTVTVRSHNTNPLEHRIAKLENLVERLLKNKGDEKAASAPWSRRSGSNGRLMNDPAADPYHGVDDLFGRAPALAAQQPKAVAPSFSNQKDENYSNLQRARELEQKRYFAAQKRTDFEKQRAHLQEHMASLKMEMAKLEAEMEALEMQAKKRKIRQSFNEGAHLDAFSSDAFREEFEQVIEESIADAFDAFDGGDTDSVFKKRP